MRYTPNDSINDVVYVFFDIETTGLDPNIENIIEFGLVKANSDKILETYQTFVSIDKSIPEQASRINGISDEMLVGAPKIKEVLEKACSIIDGNVLVAHNITFDFSFLNAELVNSNMPIIKDCLLVDTLKVARNAFPELPSHALTALTKHFDISVGQHHRALDDAIACRDVLIKCTDKLSIMGDMPLADILF